jgi:hypothetical protein
MKRENSHIQKLNKIYRIKTEDLEKCSAQRKYFSERKYRKRKLSCTEMKCDGKIERGKNKINTNHRQKMFL